MESSQKPKGKSQDSKRLAEGRNSRVGMPQSDQRPGSEGRSQSAEVKLQRDQETEGARDRVADAESYHKDTKTLSDGREPGPGSKSDDGCKKSEVRTGEPPSENVERRTLKGRGRKSNVHGRESTHQKIAEAIRRVLKGDVNSYKIIHQMTDGPLRSFIGSRYGRLGGDFVDEVAIRTHEYAFSHLDSYNSDSDATFQTWLNLRSLNVAGEVLAERLDLRRLGPRGARRRVVVSESLNEETHALRSGSGIGPADAYEARMRSHMLWQEYEALASEGRLSIALHDVEGRTLAETAQALDMPLIRVRRLLDRNHNRLRRRLKRRDVRPVECEPHYGMVRYETDDTGYDEDWTATSMAYLPDDPDSLVGAAAKSEKEDEETP